MVLSLGPVLTSVNFVLLLELSPITGTGFVLFLRRIFIKTDLVLALGLLSSCYRTFGPAIETQFCLFMKAIALFTQSEILELVFD